MKKMIIAAILAGSFAQAALADSNVALNGGVTTTGGGFDNWSSLWGSGSYAGPASVTDGVFVTQWQQWNIGTVFWNGSGGGDSNNYIDIALNHQAVINSITLQADNNDDYLIQYRNGAGPWANLLTISPPRNWGMSTASATLGAPVTADAFRILSVGGDGYYSVSEFQAFGTVVAVPEPETYAMLLAGLGLMGFIARRKKSA